MKKKVLAMLIAGMMIMSLVSCSSKDKVSEGDKQGETTEQGENKEKPKEEDKDSGEKIPEKLTVDEANKLNKKTIVAMEKLFNDKGFKGEVKERTFEGSLSEGPAIISYKNETGVKPYYNVINYSATIKNDSVDITYYLDYFVDSEKIKSGEHKVPTSRDLLISEPYKIMMGNDISNEVLDRIDKIIKETYVEGLINDETRLVTEGPFTVKLMLSTGRIEFSITTSYKY